MRYRESLPQLDGTVLLSDGGMETTLLFLDGFDLPCFASFPLLEQVDGRAALASYYGSYLDVARRHGTGFVLEACTWRANPAWGARLGYSLEDLAEANRRSVAFVEEIREAEERPGRPFVISAPIGPEGDAYDPESRMTADEAEAFHSWQVGVLAGTAADFVAGFTLSYAEEAIGIVRAASAADLPVVVSFTVETDGRLPSGQALAEAIEQVDVETGEAAAYFMINCAHPTHFLPVLDEVGPWDRILGIRANASTKSHAELDESETLDDGDPAELAEGYVAIGARLPHLTVLGGCCGTDHRHVASVADAWLSRDVLARHCCDHHRAGCPATIISGCTARDTPLAGGDRQRPRSRDLGANDRRDLGPVELDRAHRLRVVEAPDGQLEQEPAVPEDLVLEQDLLDDLLWAADEVRTAERPRGLELLARHRRPTALTSDLGHHRLERRPRYVGRLLRRVGDEAVRVDAEGRGVASRLVRGAAMDLGERREALGQAADDRERHR